MLIYLPILIKNKDDSQGEHRCMQTQSPSTLPRQYSKQKGAKDYKSKTSVEPCQLKISYSAVVSSGISKSQFEGGEQGHKQTRSPSQKRKHDTRTYDQHKPNEKYDGKTTVQVNKTSYEPKRQSYKQTNYRPHSNKQKQSHCKKISNENSIGSTDCISNMRKGIHESRKIFGLHDMTNSNSRRNIKEQTIKYVNKDDTKYTQNTKVEDKHEHIASTLNNVNIEIDYKNTGLSLGSLNQEPKMISNDVDRDIDNAEIDGWYSKLGNIELPSEVENISKTGISSTSLHNNEPASSTIYVKQDDDNLTSTMLTARSSICSPLVSVHHHCSNDNDDGDKPSIEVVLQNDADNIQVHNIISAKQNVNKQEINNLTIEEINIIKEIDHRRRIQGIGILECPCSFNLNGERVGYCDAHELIFQF